MPYAHLSALKNPNYRSYFIGQLISMAGNRMQAMVQAWLVYEMTQSALWLGIIQFTNEAAAFLSSPLAGVVADRMDRRKITIWVTIVGLIQASILTLLFFTGTLAIWHIALLSVVLGVTNSFEITNRHAFAMDLVGRKDLPSALNLNSICVNGSRIFGPSIAGLMLAKLGKGAEGYCFLFNALSYIAVLITLARVRGTPRPIAKTGERDFLSHFAQAVRYVRATPSILRVLLFSVFLSFVGFPYFVLLPVISRQVLQGNADILAWLTGWTGIGAVIAGLGFGASLGGGDGSEGSGIRRRLLIDVTLLGVSFALLGWSDRFWLSSLACLGIGYFLMGAFPKINNAIQQRSDDSMRGRVISLYTMTFTGAAPLGSLIVGALIDRFGVQPVACGIGVICVFASFAATQWDRANLSEVFRHSPP